MIRLTFSIFSILFITSTVCSQQPDSTKMTNAQLDEIISIIAGLLKI